MSAAISATARRYRTYWDDQLHEACLDTLTVALARPFDLAAFQAAVEHVAAVTQVIEALDPS